MDKKSPRILVVEDEQLLVDAIVRKLSVHGMSATTYLSGKDAIEYLKTSTTLPDAIWLDYTLKDMNGLEFMQALKSENRFSKIPVVVVSNSANMDKVTSMFSLGIKKYLLKAEYRLDDIIKIINEEIGKEKNPNASASRSILVVEDDPYSVNAYRVKLSKAGFRIKIALDGNEAMEALKTFTPDIILLDLILPKKNGFTFLEEIKTLEKWKDIPIIIASNLGSKEDLERGMKLGAIDFIVKTDTTLDEVIGRINRFMTTYSSQKNTLPKN